MSLQSNPAFKKLPGDVQECLAYASRIQEAVDDITKYVLNIDDIDFGGFEARLNISNTLDFVLLSVGWPKEPIRRLFRTLTHQLGWHKTSGPAVYPVTKEDCSVVWYFSHGDLPFSIRVEVRVPRNQLPDYFYRGGKCGWKAVTQTVEKFACNLEGNNNETGGDV